MINTSSQLVHWVIQARTEDPQLVRVAQEELTQVFSKRCTKFCCWLIAKKQLPSDYDADDLRQDATIKFLHWAKRATNRVPNSDKHVLSTMFQCCNSVFLDRIRKRQRSPNAINIKIPEVQIEQETPSNSLGQREEQQKVAEAILEICTPNERLALEMKLAGRRMTSIGEKTNRSKGSAKNWVYKIILRLRKKLGRDEQ